MTRCNVWSHEVIYLFLYNCHIPSTFYRLSCLGWGASAYLSLTNAKGGDTLDKSSIHHRANIDTNNHSYLGLAYLSLSYAAIG